MAKVKSATGKLNEFQLNKTHITTSDFGYIKPVDCRLMVPGTKYNIELNQFTRLMPMAVPTFGDVQSVSRCFVVPIVDVMSNFNDLLEGKKTAVNGSLVDPVVPYFVERNFVDFFITSDMQMCEPTTGDDGFSVIDNNTIKKYKYTSLGRKVMAWLNGLGYNIRFDSRSVNTTRYSLLPILCWFKFYIDWIVPARYVSQYSRLSQYIGINYHTNNAQFFGTILRNLLFDLATISKSYISDDYFSSAYETPFGIDDSTITNIFIDQPYNDPDNPLYNVSNVSSDTDYGAMSNLANYDSGDVSANINYFTIQSLGALQALINKGKLAGTKIQDYLMYTYGLRPNEDVLHVSHYKGAHRSTIQIGDIPSTATTDSNIGTTYLGQYAGRGLGGNSDTFQCDSGEQHCYMFITNELYVKTSYVQGSHVEVNARTRFDFFQPEFDAVGMRAVAFKELANDIDFSDFDSSDVADLPAPDAIFGFKPMYSEYKDSFDVVSGDFRDPALNTGLDSWYLNRAINKDFLDNVGYSINNAFCQSEQDAARLDKMFQYQSSDVDHFYSVFRINCKALMPMISMNRAIETDMESGKLGKEIDVDLQGHVN